jgi:hypothetical protein
MRRFLALLTVALLTCALAAAAALAAPDRTATFSATSTALAWEGSGAFGSTPNGIYECRAGGVYNCDDTLIDVKDPGTIKATGSTDGNYFMNFILYKATADGAPDGEPIGEGELGADFNLTVKGVKPGPHILRIVFRLAVNADFTAKATFVPDAAPAPAPVVAAPAPAVAAPAPAPAPAPAKPAAPAKKKPSCKAKAKKIKNAKKRKAALKRCAKKKK